jgi:hypothetical protein
MAAVAAALGSLLFAGTVGAHRAAYAKGMYCEGGNTPGQFDTNNLVNAVPFFNVDFDYYWMAQGKNCSNFPPQDNSVLYLPAGGKVMVEITESGGSTTLFSNGQYTTAWGDGLNHTDAGMNGYWEGNGPEYCMQGAPQDGGDGMLHTSNFSTTRGSGLGISYVNDPSQVTIDNHVIFSVNGSTPWFRIGTFDIPADMPECPNGYCICSWNYLPGHCGEPNLFQNIFRCQIIGSTSTKVLSAPKPANFARDDPANATVGGKQVLVQQVGINDFVNTWVPSLPFLAPSYNSVMGFVDGAQTDIFKTGVGKPNTAPQTNLIANNIVNGPVNPTTSGTIHFCEGTNWSGTCQNLSWYGGVCMGLEGTSFYHNFSSAAPSNGSCSLYTDNSCTELVTTVTNPGLSNFDKLNAQFGGIQCQ